MYSQIGTTISARPSTIETLSIDAPPTQIGTTTLCPALKPYPRSTHYGTQIKQVCPTLEPNCQKPLGDVQELFELAIERYVLVRTLKYHSYYTLGKF